MKSLSKILQTFEKTKKELLTFADKKIASKEHNQDQITQLEVANVILTRESTRARSVALKIDELINPTIGGPKSDET